MKGPSLDAIRKFKEQQERKKQEEEEKKAKDKLSAIEYRASQGDRKAKKQLKTIDKIKEERNRSTEIRIKSQGSGQRSTDRNSINSGIPNPQVKSRPKSSKGETKFEDLMLIAKKNGEKKIEPKSSSYVVKSAPIPKLSNPESARSQTDKKPVQHVKLLKKPTEILNHSSKPKSPNPVETMQDKPTLSKSVDAQALRLRQMRARQQRMRENAHPSQHYRFPDEGYDDDYDDYEEDDFVVDEEEDGVQDAVSDTIRELFNYNKRKCDMRERELDREYRAIGRVSTFEDLEREERRASRLAAAEDALEQRNEEERKRLKRIRLNKR